MGLWPFGKAKADVEAASRVIVLRARDAIALRAKLTVRLEEPQTQADADGVVEQCADILRALVREAPDAASTLGLEAALSAEVAGRAPNEPIAIRAVEIIGLHIVGDPGHHVRPPPSAGAPSWLATSAAPSSSSDDRPVTTPLDRPTPHQPFPAPRFGASVLTSPAIKPLDAHPAGAHAGPKDAAAHANSSTVAATSPHHAPTVVSAAPFGSHARLIGDPPRAAPHGAPAPRAGIVASPPAAHGPPAPPTPQLPLDHGLASPAAHASSNHNPASPAAHASSNHGPASPASHAPSNHGPASPASHAPSNHSPASPAAHAPSNHGPASPAAHAPSNHGPAPASATARQPPPRPHDPFGKTAVSAAPSAAAPGHRPGEPGTAPAPHGAQLVFSVPLERVAAPALDAGAAPRRRPDSSLPPPSRSDRSPASSGASSAPPSRGVPHTYGPIPIAPRAPSPTDEPSSPSVRFAGVGPPSSAGRRASTSPRMGAARSSTRPPPAAVAARRRVVAARLPLPSGAGPYEVARGLTPLFRDTAGRILVAFLRTYDLTVVRRVPFDAVESDILSSLTAPSDGAPGAYVASHAAEIQRWRDALGAAKMEQLQREANLAAAALAFEGFAAEGVSQGTANAIVDGLAGSAFGDPDMIIDLGRYLYPAHETTAAETLANMIAVAGEEMPPDLEEALDPLFASLREEVAAAALLAKEVMVTQ